jgi:hypothetical protein
MNARLPKHGEHFRAALSLRANVPSVLLLFSHRCLDFS